MATNTSALKTFAQQTRAKLIQLITTRLNYVLHADTAELRGYESELNRLRSEIDSRSQKQVVEEVAYTWFNRVMALRYMDANDYNSPRVVSPAAGQMRPEILQEALAGNVDDDLGLTAEEKLLPEAKLYRRLLVASCNQFNPSMPFLFERIKDYSELLLPEDLLSDQSFVTDIRNGMTDEDCENVQIMGWLYQFYITDRKADAEAKKGQKGGLNSDEQAAATQLFTPHWIVRYMVENSLGRIWMTLHPESRLIDQMPYYIEMPEGQTTPIPEDIHSVKDIRFLDPCVGSGHIVVYAFDLFTKMYEEEGYSEREIPGLIIENNLYGMDIDRRCYQLACFALTMKGRAYYRRYLRHTVQPNVIALQPISHDTIEATGAWSDKSLVWQMEHIDTIGALLKITPEECEAINVTGGLFGQDMKVMKTQAEYLSRGYHCVVTNPPYLGKGISDILRDYVSSQFPASKADLMACFMERCSSLCYSKGLYSMINMQSWMFFPTYIDLRHLILDKLHIVNLLHLGAHAFDELSGEFVQNAAFVMSNQKYENSASYFKLDEGMDCTTKENLFLKSLSENTGLKFDNVKQNDFLNLPDCAFIYDLGENLSACFKHKLIEDFCLSNGQNITGNNDKYIRDVWEVNRDSVHKDYWVLCARGGGFRKYYGNINHVIRWDPDTRAFYKSDKIARIISEKLRFRQGITWSYVCSGHPTFRKLNETELFEKAGTSVFVKDESKLNCLLGLVNSSVATAIYKKFAPATKLQVHDMFLLPVNPRIFDDNKINNIVNANIDLEKKDWDSHETSWDFQKNEIIRLKDEEFFPHATINDEPVDIGISLNHLIDQYKMQWDAKFKKLHANEEELNRQFIEIYGLQDELTPDVSLDEVTILQKGEISIEDNQIVWHDDVIIKQLLSYLVGCFMGRYSVDRPGLIIASQHQDLKAIDLQIDGMEDTPQSTLSIDDDGIIPLVQDADFFADDMPQRIEHAIEVIFGKEQKYDNLRYIENTLGQPLRTYLYKDFYADHQAMYSVKGKKRPIYWMFSSAMGQKKKKGYFRALVYVHRMEPDTLSKLHADYVHPYLEKAERQLLEAEENSTRDSLSQTQRNKALKEVEALRDKVREVKEFENKLVEMATAQISIDLDDGVKHNYPLFYPLVEPIKGLDKKED